jgi:hypothetical protein
VAALREALEGAMVERIESLSEEEAQKLLESWS